MNSDKLRLEFLQFFQQRDHKLIPSAPLVPGNDPSLLFTSAGMVQFKDIFLGTAKAPAPRAVSAQKCLRAGGKHNDLEHVGYTARHHTFFEMLGNFSFGDYFKQEAIAYAWEFLTQVAGLEADALWVSVHESDDESAAIWRNDIGVKAKRILRLGDVDNFWTMGETGPCGPCSEIYFDHGAHIAGGPPGSEEEGDRWVEVWNLVFMQYARRADGSMSPLPAPSVDTGMGLERLVAAVQKQVSNYDTDLFVPLQEQLAAQLGLSGDALHGADSSSLRVIADHLRALSFMLADNIQPSNVGRGYVLRRILRRATRHGHRLGAREPFLSEAVPFLADRMGAAYPELKQQGERIARIIREEEEQFSLALERGMKILKAWVEAHLEQPLSGELVFELHDTYGFPADMTADFAREAGLSWDQAGYQREMEQQKQRARAASGFSSARTEGLATIVGTRFSGYQQLQGKGQVLGLWQEGKPVPELAVGEEGLLALDQSPFYAEGGGQVGDRGELHSKDGRAEVLDCVREGEVQLHRVQVSEGHLSMGDTVSLQVAAERRAAIMRNHSATHLMNAALRHVLGNEVHQRGSLVDSEHLRFDFSHPQKVSADELWQVEGMVAEQILANSEVGVRVMAREQALKAGAMAMFGEKYGEQVRVLNMGGDFSVELCGGTHVARTGDIGMFRILSESSVAAGVRRIEAITGRLALEWYRGCAYKMDEAARQLRCSLGEVSERLAAHLSKDNGGGKPVPISIEVLQGADSALMMQHTMVPVAAAQELRELRTMLAAQPQSISTPMMRVLIAATDDDQCAILVDVPPELQKILGADEVVRFFAELVGGKGGGKSDFAQGGGGEAKKLPEAVPEISRYIASKLAL